MNVGRLRGGRALPLGISGMTNVDRLSGGRQGRQPAHDMRLPCAGGGKGRPRPLHPGDGLRPFEPQFLHSARICSPARRAVRAAAPHAPRPGRRPLEPQFDACLPSAWRTCLRADQQRQRIHVSAYRRHVMRDLGRHHCRGFGGVLAPNGEREGQSPLDICSSDRTCACHGERQLQAV